MEKQKRSSTIACGAPSRRMSPSRVLTMHLAPRRILLNVEVRFSERLGAREIVAAITRLESAVRAQLPSVQEIFVEASALASPSQ